MRRQRMAAIAIVGVLAVLAAGCGSKKTVVSETTPTTTAAAADQTTTEAMTTSSSSTSTSSSEKPSFASTKNCAELESLAAKIAKSVTPGSGKDALKTQSDALKAMADAAPDEIKGDFKTFADAFTKLESTYASLNLKPGAAPSADQVAKLSAAAQTLSSPKIQAATQRLSAWATKNCGISTTSP